MPRKKQGLRSYHHKTRNGCSNCKRRRVKCNMQAPICANCARRNETCEYQNLDEPQATPLATGLLAIWNPNPITITSGSSDALQRPIPGYFPELWNSHAGPNTGTIESSLTLLHPLAPSLRLLFRNSLFLHSEQTIWIDAIEKQAPKNPYIAHSIAALSSLIQELGQPIYNAAGSQTPIFAYQHHIAASELFRRAPPSVDDDNWMSVLAFGVVMLLFQFATQQACAESEFDIFETLLFLRTSMGANRTALPYLVKSPLWPLVQYRVQKFPNKLNSKTQTALDRLACTVSQAAASQDSDAARINQAAYWELREWAYACRGQSRTWNYSFSWAASVSEDYLKLMEQKDDIAILIFIHWCLIMYETPWRWFIATWSRRAALKAMSWLKADWGEALNWPMDVLGIRSMTFAHRPLPPPPPPDRSSIIAESDMPIDPLLLGTSSSTFS